MKKKASNNIESILLPKEQIMWKGKPGKGHLLSSVDIVSIPFGLSGIIFQIITFKQVLSDMPIILGPVFIVVPTFFCLYIAIGQIMHRDYIRKHTEYYITNKRIIRLQKNRMDVISGYELKYKTVSVWKDGFGTIEFGRNPPENEMIFGAKRNFILDNIPEVKKVIPLIEELTNKH